MANTNMKTLDNIRASVAYGFAEKGVQYKEYKPHVKKIPMLIKTNGLGATIAFMFSKKKDYAYTLINQQISEWFSNADNPHRLEFTDFQKKILSLDSKEYRIVTAEVMALFTWLRRFAEGLAKDGGNESQN